MNKLFRATTCCVAAAVFMHWVPMSVRAEPARLTTLAVDELKRAYLWCDRAAANGRLRAAEIAQCSVFYEDLKRRAFDGDFERLLAWSRTRQGDKVHDVPPHEMR
jgi:hypothetical protein